MTAPYLIEIIPADRGWILEKIALAIKKEADRFPHKFQVKILDKATDTAELVFFLPESAFQPLKNSITVTYLAHKENHAEAAALFEQVARATDYCITSSTKYKKILEADGAKKVFKIHLGVDTAKFTPKLKLGIVGRAYHTGRKGEHLLAEIADLPMVDLQFTGEGWPYPATYYSESDLVKFYQSIDYLLVPSLIEGGPVPLLEALATGCPVIAPSDLGLVEDFPHIPFENGNGKDLRRVIEELLQKKMQLRDSVNACDWSIFSEKHLAIFSNLIEEKRQKNQGEYNTVSSLSLQNPRVLLVTHSEEKLAKGGPSYRVRMISRQLQADGCKVDFCHNIKTTEDCQPYDIIHVFNAWPPHVAIQTISLAKQAGKKVVFSPIFLDLRSHPIYRSYLEFILNSGDENLIELAIYDLPKLVREKCYSHMNSELPLELVPGHFEILRKCCSIADRVVFVSEHEKKLLAALGAKTSHGVLIHNGVDDVFSDKEPNLSLFQKKLDLEKYVLCVGRIEYRKNQALLAKAMCDLQIPLVLIGDEGDSGYLDKVNMFGGDNLYHFPHIDDRDLLVSAYARANFFVLPSWCEGASLATLEAGLLGVPLLLSDTSAEREYFGDHANYIDPSDVASMKKQIIELWNSKETVEARNERKNFLKENYSSQQHVQKTWALYQNLMVDEADTKQGELVVDLSSFSHAVRFGLDMIGVFFAEKNMLQELLKSRPDLRCILYKDAQNCFIEVPNRFMSCREIENLESVYSLAPEKAGPVDLRLSFGFSQSFPSFVLSQSMLSTGRSGRLVRLVVRVANRLGFPVEKLKKCLKLVWKLRFSFKNKIHGFVSRLLKSAKSNKEKLIDIQNSIQLQAVPRPLFEFAPKTRILTLGQGWLSNEPLLDKLIELAAGHQLEAYVYDISYVTGAHFSGWLDVQAREHRLEKLLRNCSVVYSESKTSASEIAKFSASRSFSPKIVRTQLSSKLPKFSTKSMPSLFKRNFVLYVSSFNKRKNHDFLVNVWRDLVQNNTIIARERVKLIFVGCVQGEEKYGESDFQHELAKYNIEIINNVDDQRLMELYNDCLFTVYPSLQEGWGIPVQESLCHGKICLVSETVPAAIEINNSALIKLSPHDFFSWREALISWVGNQKMREKFEGFALNYKPPSWEEIAKPILELSN